MKTLDLVREGRLNLQARKGFGFKFYLDEVPVPGNTYALIAKNDRDEVALTINGVIQATRIMFSASAINIPTGEYKYDVVATNTSTSAKRCPLAGVLLILP